VIDANVTLPAESSISSRAGIGRFRIAAATGSHVRRVSAISDLPLLQNVVISQDGDEALSVVTEPIPVQLPEMSTTAAPQEAARLAGFELRRRTAGGQYATAEEIERKRVMVRSDVLRSMQGVPVQQIGLVGVTRPGVSEDTGTRLAGTGAVLKGLRGGKLNRQGGRVDCHLALFVDGQRWYDLWSIDQIAPPDVAGIDVDGAAPASVDLIGLQAEEECGVVMVWRRSGKKPR